MLNYIDIFINLKYTINKSLNDFNNLIFKRDRLLNFTSVFLFICKYNSDKTDSYSSSISSLINDDCIPDVSKSAFISKLKLIHYKYFIKINNIVIDFFYNTINKDLNIKKTPMRFFAIDTSKIHFKKSLDVEFKLSKNKNYTTGCLSCLFDIDYNFPVNYLLSNSFDERKLLIDQFSYINSNDVIIADRGYFSHDLVNKLLEKNYNFIFRVNKNNNFINKINFNNKEQSAIFNHNLNGKIYKLKVYKYITHNELKSIDKNKINTQIHKNKILINKIDKQLIIVNNNNKKLLTKKEKKTTKEETKNINLLIKNNKKIKTELLIELNKIKEENKECYKQIKESNLDNDPYYLLTSCYELTNEKLKEIYKKRWLVETNFRFLKSNFKFDRLNSININTIKQNLYACQFLFIIESLVNYITPNEKINIDKILDSKKSTLNKIKVLTSSKMNIKNTCEKEKIMKTTNKSLSLKLIGNNLLKNMLIIRMDEKGKKELYDEKTTIKKRQEILKEIIIKKLKSIVKTINIIIKNKIKIKKDKKEYNKRITMRPQKTIWM